MKKYGLPMGLRWQRPSEVHSDLVRYKKIGSCGAGARGVIIYCIQRAVLIDSGIPLAISATHTAPCSNRYVAT